MYDARIDASPSFPQVHLCACVVAQGAPCGLCPYGLTVQCLPIGSGSLSLQMLPLSMPPLSPRGILDLGAGLYGSPPFCKGRSRVPTVARSEVLNYKSPVGWGRVQIRFISPEGREPI